jgi:glycosyltransferase involved in cell wall biosynthesis
VNLLYVVPIDFCNKQKNGTSVIVDNFIKEHSKLHSVSVLQITARGAVLVTGDDKIDVEFYRNNFVVVKPFSVKNFRFKVKGLDFNNYDKVIVFRADLFYFIKSNNIDKRRIVFYPIDLMSRIYNQMESNNYLYKIYKMYQYVIWSSIEKRYSDLSDYVFFVSSRDSEIYKKKYGVSDNIYHLRNGVDNGLVKYEKKARDDDKLVISFSGDFSYKPNNNSFLYIFNELISKIPKSYKNIVIALIGRNPPVSPGTYRVKDDVTIIVTGEVEDIRSELSKTDVYFCPLQEGAGMKNKILEVMSLSIPFCATAISVDGIDELVESQSFCLLDNSNKNDWFDKLIDYSSSDLSKKHVIRNNNIINARYTWQMVVSDFDKISGVS